MKKFKKAIGFLVFIFLVLAAIPSVSYAAEQQYTDNLIPVMTGDTSPSGKASASSVKTDSNTYPAYKAFDHSTSNLSVWASDGVVGWLEFDFGINQIVNKYVLKARSTSSVSDMPKSWTFEAFDELLKNWIILDTQINANFTLIDKKEFVFYNNKAYKKYRINITENGGNPYYTSLAELEMMGPVLPQISAPANLIAAPGNEKIDLSWTAVDGATSYIIKRSITSGGPYDTISTVTGSVITFTDTGLTNGITYYYVVIAVNTNGESGNSNEASATPIAASDPSTITGNKAILVISFNNGKEKEYDLTATEIDKYVTWYDAKSDGAGKSYFTLPKRSNVKPFIGRKEYIKFENIESFEIKDYNE